MRGTVEECLRDFFQHSPLEQVDALQEFVGISPKTLRRWKAGDGLAQGEMALRLRAFLWVASYQLDELKDVKPSALRVALLIGFQVEGYGVAEVQERLRYSNTQALYRLLVLGGEPAKTQAYRLEMLARDTDELIDAVRGPWRERLMPTIVRLQDSSPVPEGAVVVSRPNPVPTVEKSVPVDGSESGADPTALAYLILALGSSVEEIVRAKEGQAIRQVRRHVPLESLVALRDFFGRLTE